MILEMRIEAECVGGEGRSGRDCDGKTIDAKCMEAGENGGACEYMCVNQVYSFREVHS